MNKILLSDDHTGSRVNYIGLFTQSRAALISAREPMLAESLLQFEENLDELGQRWYAGDTAVMDEFLQFYCVAADARKKLKLSLDAEPISA